MAWFRISFAEKAFLRILAARGVALETMTVDDGVSAMLKFYTEHRAQHTRLDEDGDMLLLQWSSGRLDVTRQLIRSGTPDSPIHQLSLRFTTDTVLPPAGDVWYVDPTASITAPAFFTGQPARVDLSFDVV